MKHEQPDSVDRALDDWGASARTGAPAPVGTAFALSVRRERRTRYVRSAAAVACVALCIGGAWLAVRPGAFVTPEEDNPLLAGHDPGGVGDIDAVVLDARRPTAATLLRINAGTRPAPSRPDAPAWSLAWASEQSPGV